MRFFAFGLMASLMLSSCTQKGVKYREIPAGRLVKKDDSSQKIDEAKHLYDLGEIDAAISTLRLFVDSRPYDFSHDQAYELIIEWLLQLKRTTEAKRLASYFLAKHPQSESAQKIIDLFGKPAAGVDTSPQEEGATEEE
ncbi:MAG TPA: hypothetical protein VEL47_03885 [Myxococcota bacterium]|nr:hypothetical protein [Myxococcota bacterium]